MPWEKDDLRDKPNDREFMFNKFEEALINSKKPYIILRGNQETRLKKAINQINNLLKK
jgi:nicotinamide riboside kinase